MSIDSSTHYLVSTPSFPQCITAREIKEEMYSLSIEIRILFDNIVLYLKNYLKGLLKHDELTVINYLEGTISLDEIGITRENAAHYLNIAKTIDLALIYQSDISGVKLTFKNSTYPIRSKILELLTPEIQTIEVYTLTLLHKKLSNSDYLNKPLNWHPERLTTNSKLISSPNELSIDTSPSRLSKKYKIYTLRGSTASGKTTIAKKILEKAAIKQRITHRFDPDLIKEALKNSENLTNRQVHEELKGPLSRFKFDVLKLPHNVVIDMGIYSCEDFERNILDVSEDRKIKVFDIDTSLLTIFKRVFSSRDPKGSAPFVHPKDIIKNFTEIKQGRLGIINRVKQEASVTHYLLLHTDDDGVEHRVAEKKGSIFKIFSETLFKVCITPPSNEEIDQLNQIIVAQEFIENVAKGTSSSDLAIERMMPWQGFPLRKAMEFKSMGIPISTAQLQLDRDIVLEKQIGPIKTEPFTDTWLKDFPAVLNHILSEHILHVRGVDEEGRGLTWTTNKFRSKFNPQYNPEAKNGFQMKVGYFLIPSSKIDTFHGHTLPPKILSDLQVINTDGELLGYRFFVHPESYCHFRSLLDDSSITFVRPKDSEFIGTPTSSTRSLMIRRIVEKDNQFMPQHDSIPFIIKMSVGNAWDNSGLLSKNDILRSITAQKRLNKIVDGSELLLFKECLGIIPKDIENYPSNFNLLEEAISSGNIIRILPESLLNNECEIHSFSALMSMERTKNSNFGICRFNGFDENTDALPLIYPLIKNAIDRGAVSSSSDYINKYLIKMVLKALEPFLFKEGLSIALHAQNLCMVFDKNGLPISIAYRDLEAVHNDSSFIQSFEWFYRYHCLVKIGSVITTSEDSVLPTIPRAPRQIGDVQPYPERSLNNYIRRKVSEKDNINVLTLDILNNLSITFDDFTLLLQNLDDAFWTLLSRYFNLASAGISKLELPLITEADSVFESHPVLQFNEKLKSHHYYIKDRSPISARKEIDRLNEEALITIISKITHAANQSLRYFHTIVTCRQWLHDNDLNLSKITVLNLDESNIETLPPEVCDLISLQKLYLRKNLLSELPSTIGKLKALETLNLFQNQLSSLPSEIGKLKNLKSLTLNDNHLSTLPKEIGELEALKELMVYDNPLSSLLSEINKLPALKKIAIICSTLKSLSEIEKLAAKGCEILGLNK